MTYNADAKKAFLLVRGIFRLTGLQQSQPLSNEPYALFGFKAVPWHDLSVRADGGACMQYRADEGHPGGNAGTERQRARQCPGGANGDIRLRDGAARW